MKKSLLLILTLCICSYVYAQTFVPDILGGKFECATIVQPKDYEGDVVCSLIRLKSEKPTCRAVLYIHGFNDYFFQHETAEQFASHGYNFYALDLRKYGRSLLPHQLPCNARKIREYYADIDTAISTIENEGNNFIVLAGHSTGGLIASVYADEGKYKKDISALWLNSPFFDMNMSKAMKRIGTPIVAGIGGVNPNIGIPLGNSTFYGESLHKNYKGEWDYNLNWKTLKSPNMKTGWIRTIYRTQRKLRKGLHVLCPILVMHSDKTLGGNKWDDSFARADIVLNVEDIRKYAVALGPDVTIKEIEGGKHDLTLSVKPVRDEVFRVLFLWLDAIR